MRVVGLQIARHAVRLVDLSGESQKGADPAPEGLVVRPLGQASPVESQRFLQAPLDEMRLADAKPAMDAGKSATSRGRIRSW